MGRIAYLGEVTILSCLPVIASAKTLMVAAVTATLPDIAARLAGALAVSVQLKPLSFVASLAAVGNLAAQLTALIALGIQPPSVTIQAAAFADLIARLQLAKVTLQALLSWGEFAGTVSLFVYEGKASDMGTAVQSLLQSGSVGHVKGSDDCIAPILVVAASDRTAVASLRACVKTS